MGESGFSAAAMAAADASAPQASFSRTSWLTTEPSARPETCGITSAITRPKSRMLVALGGGPLDLLLRPPQARQEQPRRVPPLVVARAHRLPQLGLQALDQAH